MWQLAPAAGGSGDSRALAKGSCLVQGSHLCQVIFPMVSVTVPPSSILWERILCFQDVTVLSFFCSSCPHGHVATSSSSGMMQKVMGLSSGYARIASVVLLCLGMGQGHKLEGGTTYRLCSLVTSPGLLEDPDLSVNLERLPTDTYAICH